MNGLATLDSVAVVGGTFTGADLSGADLTDATLGSISLGNLSGLTDSIKGDVATINFDGNLGSGSASFTFANPASNSPVPEPATLSLMATGLLGVAGALRRRFATAA